MIRPGITAFIECWGHKSLDVLGYGYVADAAAQAAIVANDLDEHVNQAVLLESLAMYERNRPLLMILMGMRR